MLEPQKKGEAPQRDFAWVFAKDGLSPEMMEILKKVTSPGFFFTWGVEPQIGGFPPIFGSTPTWELMRSFNSGCDCSCSIVPSYDSILWLVNVLENPYILYV